MIFTRDAAGFIKCGRVGSAAQHTHKHMGKKGNNTRLASAVPGQRKLKTNISSKGREHLIQGDLCVLGQHTENF